MHDQSVTETSVFLWRGGDCSRLKGLCVNLIGIWPETHGVKDISGQLGRFDYVLDILGKWC